MMPNGSEMKENGYNRLDIFDIINNIPVACLISKKETSKIIYDFIDISIPLKHRKAIITDLKEDYEQIMIKLGFAHQQCTFHLIKKHDNQLKTKNKRRTR